MSSLPLTRLVIAADPEYAQYVLVENNKNYRKSLAYDMIRLLLGNGLIEQPDYFKNLFRQIINEKTGSSSNAEVERLKELNKIIDEDFARFDDVFRALA